MTRKRSEREEPGEHLGRMVLKIRREQGVTQAMMSKETGIQQSRISKIESGIVRLTINEIMILLDF
jgi:predicted transcriptional regulator